MIKELTCITCPMGCSLHVELSNSGEVLNVTGNTCPRGAAYARSEMTNPTRSLTSTVKVDGGDVNVIPVKSKGALPKGKLLDCCAALRDVSIKAPVAIGDVVVADILGTGIDIVATNIAKAK